VDSTRTLDMRRSHQSKGSSLSVGALIIGALVVLPSMASAQTPIDSAATLFGRPVIRDGFHFQVAFGVGGGPDTAGVFHAMEIGGTFKNGLTLGVLHTFIQNDGVFAENNGPDLFGGWLLMAKMPIFYPEIVGKIAVGLGGTHDQSDGINATGGLGWAYGVDFHLPTFARSGITLSALAIHAYVEGKHHFGGGFGVGYTFY